MKWCAWNHQEESWKTTEEACEDPGLVTCLQLANRPEWMSSTRDCLVSQLGGAAANCNGETTALSFAKQDYLLLAAAK